MGVSALARKVWRQSGLNVHDVPGNRAVFIVLAEIRTPGISRGRNAAGMWVPLRDEPSGERNVHGDIHITRRVKINDRGLHANRAAQSHLESGVAEMLNKGRQVVGR